MNHDNPMIRSGDSKPIVVLSVAMFLITAGLLWITWSGYELYQLNKRMSVKNLRIAELKGIITHLDEVLTMSARMASVSGDPRWEERYNQFEPKLYTAIKEAEKIVPNAYTKEAAGQTDTANMALVKMERLSFDWVRQGRLEEAQAVLFSGEYETQKEIYAGNMEKLGNGLDRVMYDALEEVRGRAFFLIVSLLAVISMLFLGWTTIFKTTRKWQATLLEADQQRLKQSEELVAINQNLDRKIAEATQAIAQEHAEKDILLKSITSILIGVDGNNRITLWNKAAETTFDIPASQALGRSFFDCDIPWDHAQVLKAIEAARLNQTTVRLDEVPYTCPSRGDGFLGITMNPVNYDNGATPGFLIRGADITQRKELEDKRKETEYRLQSLIDNIADGVVTIDERGTILSFSRKAEEMFGYTAQEVTGKNVSILMPEKHATEHDGYLQYYLSTAEAKILGRRRQDEGRRKDGVLFPIELSVNEMSTGEKRIFTGLVRNITDQKQAEKERMSLEVQLRHAQKLEAIGQLAAGIAHEINTPTQYVGDNTHFLQQAFQELTRAIKAYHLVIEAVDHGQVTSDLLAESKALTGDIDIHYLLEEVPKAIEQSLEGIKRVTNIVNAMKDFSHPGTEEKLSVDLNQSIESTITVSRNEWKYVATMETDFDPDLPPVTCLPGEINQVILNMIVNAAHAIADVVKEGGQSMGTIAISTRLVDHCAEIRIRDTGSGISNEVRSKVFDPFFTTKEVGKGTGQGLAISHAVIVGKHGGTIDFESDVGRGTTFIIRLPIESGQPREGRRYEATDPLRRR